MGDEHIDEKVQDMSEYQGIWVATRAEDKEMTYTPADAERFLAYGKNAPVVLREAERLGHEDCNLFVYKDPNFVPEDMSKYYEKWVATPTFLEKKNIVAFGDDVNKVTAEAKALGHEDPVVYFYNDPSIPKYISAWR